MSGHNPRDWEDVFCGIQDHEDCAYSELNGECQQANCPYQITHHESFDETKKRVQT